jgi:hypothetical protein
VLHIAQVSTYSEQPPRRLLILHAPRRHRRRHRSRHRRRHRRRRPPSTTAGTTAMIMQLLGPFFPSETTKIRLSPLLPPPPGERRTVEAVVCPPPPLLLARGVRGRMAALLLVVLVAVAAAALLPLLLLVRTALARDMQQPTKNSTSNGADIWDEIRPLRNVGGGR